MPEIIDAPLMRYKIKFGIEQAPEDRHPDEVEHPSTAFEAIYIGYRLPVIGEKIYADENIGGFEFKITEVVISSGEIYIVGLCYELSLQYGAPSYQDFVEKVRSALTNPDLGDREYNVLEFVS